MRMRKSGSPRYAGEGMLFIWESLRSCTAAEHTTVWAMHRRRAIVWEIRGRPEQWCKCGGIMTRTIRLSIKYRVFMPNGIIISRGSFENLENLLVFWSPGEPFIRIIHLPVEYLAIQLSCRRIHWRQEDAICYFLEGGHWSLAGPVSRPRPQHPSSSRWHLSAGG